MVCVHRGAQPSSSAPPPKKRLSSWRPHLSTADDILKLPRAEPSHRQRFGIALLCRGADAACLHSFVRYHRFIGVEAIYLYLDDPLEAPSLRLDKLKSELSGLDFSLDVTLCTREYWKQRLTSSTMIARRFEHKVFDDAARCWRDEAQSRQSLCIEEAIEKASYDGLDWLLHIDIDECLLPQRTHPSDFFGLLPSEVEQVFFSNFEGVPPSSDLVDWFAECDEFKVNPSCCQEEGACGEGGPPRSNQREVEELWRAHQSEKQRAAAGSQRFTATSYFTAYVGGKSAVRIPRRRSGGGTPYLPVPFDVHKFLLPNGPGLWRAPRTLTCSESLDLTSLKELYLADCSSLTVLPDLSALTSLQELDLSDCSSLTALPDLSALTSLQTLNLWDCSSLTALPDRSVQKRLNTFVPPIHLKEEQGSGGCGCVVS